MNAHVRWYSELRVGEAYYIVGFVDRRFSAPHIATYVYLGTRFAEDGEPEGHRVLDAQSYFDAADVSAEASYLLLRNENLDMVADRSGLIDWLQSVDSTSVEAT